jgi:uncharacterized damage-inducible protein DinB
VAVIDVPPNSPDEHELLLSWLDFLRGAVLRKVAGLDEGQARWQPDGRLISLLGIVNHLTHLEWRWIDGCFMGVSTHRDEAEFTPGAELTVEEAVRLYRERAETTRRTVLALPLTAPCSRREGADLRWVLLHLINETARHAGHADATRELLDGLTGE